jgi:hypothetical protein
MGFFKKVFKPVRKIAKKIIPKEIRPFLPYIAAGIPGAQGLASLSFMNPAAQKALFAGLTSAATDEDGNPLRAAALAAAPDVLSSGLGTVAQKYGAAGDTADAITFTERVADIAGKTKQGIEGAGALKTIGAQTAIDQAAKFAEINQDEIDKYNEELRKQGVLDKTKRRTSILNIYLNAGYEPEYVNSMLDRYGYDEGGLAKLRKQYDALMSKMRAPETVAKTSAKLRRKPKDDETMIPPKKPKDPEDKDEEEPVLVKDVDKDLAGGLMAAAQGVEKAFGTPFGGVEPVPMLRFAQGGEVEIEEETDDLGIMDLMRDQGIEYGEQVSAPGPKDGYDDIARQLFGKGYKDLTPEELEMFQEELERLMNKFRSGMDDEGIMKMASGYKTDIEEMYEQYVFEMEEQGLQPMSFSDFLRQARAGMADGGIMEKDMRGGGFIPEGTKERADDVPARLSKNEFVMTADAVRAAGGGSVNKGAKRMYDMMYNLEGKV